MRAGRLDRRVVIEQNTSGRDAAGGETKSWSTLATVWAAVAAATGRETDAAGAVQTAADIEFTLRWRGDIDETMRIVHDGRTYEIEAIAEIGRREGLKITARKAGE